MALPEGRLKVCPKAEATVWVELYLGQLLCKLIPKQFYTAVAGAVTIANHRPLNSHHLQDLEHRQRYQM